MSEHNRLSPSSMSRILECPGSAVHSPPQRGSDAATEGTFAHELCERILQQGAESVDDKEFKNEEMEKSVFEYVAYIKSHKTHDELDGVDHTNSVLFVEERIVSIENPDHGGTIDALIVSDTHIHVNDFKYGLYPVDPANNKQILSYLALAHEKYPGRKRFFGSIIQPRVYGSTQCVEYTLDEVESHGLDVLLVGGSDERVAGNHCKWCPLKMGCKALDEKQKELAQVSFDDIQDDSWDGERCKDMIAWGAVFAELVKDSHNKIHRLLMDGEEVKGWRLAKSLGNRSWKDEAEVVKRFDKVPHNVLFNEKIKSPAQMEKVSAKNKPLVAELSHRVEKGVIAVTEDSKLPTFSPQDIFPEIEK